MSDDCGCCATPATHARAEIRNRPGLGAIDYRLGTFGSFRQALLDQVARVPALADLTTRASDDYTVSVIELWSAVADVLTFHEERIANEAYLRTAVLRDSMLRLVRLLGYELGPGSAATALLAFTLEAGARAEIPAATRVQSVPAAGETPQKFETLASIVAAAHLNALPIQPPPQPSEPTAKGRGTMIVAPDAAALATAAALAPGDRVLFYAPTAIEMLALLEARRRGDQLALEWTAPLASDAFTEAWDGATAGVGARKCGRSFRLFGHDAPSSVVMAARTNDKDATTTYLTTSPTDFALTAMPASPALALDARYPGLKAGATVLVVVTAGGKVKAAPFTIGAVVDQQRVLQTTAKTDVASGTVTHLTLAPQADNLFASATDLRDIVVYELLGEPLRFWPYRHPGVVRSTEVVISGRRAGWSAVEIGRSIEKGAYTPGTVVDVTDFAPGRNVLLVDGSGGEPVAAAIVGAALAGADVRLAATDADRATIARIGLGPGQATPLTVLLSRELVSPVSLSGPRELSVTIGEWPAQVVTFPASAGALPPGSLAASLQAALRAALPAAPAFANALVWPIGDALAVAAGIPGEPVAFGPSIADPETLVAMGLGRDHVRYLDGLMGAPVTPDAGQSIDGTVAVTLGFDAPFNCGIVAAKVGASEIADAIAANCGLVTATTADGRVIVLAPPPATEPYSCIRLSLAPRRPAALDAGTARLLGNIAPASHGETIREEILGDGDASRPFQRFSLKKKPVTYVPAAVPGGGASSLSVFVDGVRWDERPSLYGATRRDQAYATRIADDGTLTVQFGDGESGARPLTGRQNIRARYRQGTGRAGQVRAGQLSTLLDRPTGVKGVTNPIAADGGVDPETLDGARAAAPATVRTFGRAVSRRDFEDTALMNREVARALATWVWTGTRRLIHLTVAGPDGATFSSAGLERILATLGTERDPNHPLLIGNYVPVGITLDATLIVNERHVASTVLTAARAAVIAALAFEARRFAEPVYLSDLYRVLQDVPGVTAVDLNRLDLKRVDALFRERHGLADVATQPQPAARLLLLPARWDDATGTVLPAELARIEAPDQDIQLRTTGGLTG